MNQIIKLPKGEALTVYVPSMAIKLDIEADGRGVCVYTDIEDPKFFISSIDDKVVVHSLAPPSVNIGE